MNLLLKKIITVVALICPALALADYPEKPITLLAGFAAGGGADIIARKIAEVVQKNTGVDVTVINVPGAAGIIAAAKYKRDNSIDGYTLLYVPTGAFLDEPESGPKSYSTEDFIPISFPAVVPMCIGVNYKTGVKTFAELVELAKVAPDNVSYASAGPTDTSVKWATKFEKSSGIKLFSVPYKSGPQQISDLVAGVIPVVISTCAAQAGPMANRLSRTVAVTSKVRLPSMPEVPAVAEFGFKNTETQMWFGFFLNKGTPNAVSTRVNKIVNDAINSDEVKQTVAKMHGTSRVLTLPAAKIFFDTDFASQ
jgi:tripartite-type tricarboxylate transporter receptor subunit TctC